LVVIAVRILVLFGRGSECQRGGKAWQSRIFFLGEILGPAFPSRPTGIGPTESTRRMGQRGGGRSLRPLALGLPPSWNGLALCCRKIAVGVGYLSSHKLVVSFSL